MKKLFIRTIVLTSVVIFLLSGLYFGLFLLPFDNYRYLGADVDKQAILKKTKSPKVLIVGGSNVAFSIDAKEIANALNMPVINMGLHANLGLRYMLSEVKQFIYPGDLVIIIPEYEHFFNLGLDGNGLYLMDLIYSNSGAVRYFDTPGQYWNLVSSFPNWVLKFYSIRLFGEVPKGVYSRLSFDKTGNINVPLIGQKESYISSLAFIGDPRQDAIDLLDDFVQYANNNTVSVLLSYPAYPQSEFEINREEIMELYKKESSEKNLDFINHPEDCLFQKEYFYDSNYHMNYNGKKVWTNKLIKNILDNKKTI